MIDNLEPPAHDWRREFQSLDADGDRALNVFYRDGGPQYYEFRNPTHPDPFNSGYCLDVGLLVPRVRKDKRS